MIVWIIMDVTMITNLCDVTPCSLVDIYKSEKLTLFIKTVGDSTVP
jgi:hypothetical protein